MMRLLILFFSLFFLFCSCPIKAISLDDFLDIFGKEENVQKGHPGHTVVKISLNHQALYIVKDGKIVLATHVCTGKGDTTPTGHFKVLDKQQRK